MRISVTGYEHFKIFNIRYTHIFENMVEKATDISSILSANKTFHFCFSSFARFTLVLRLDQGLVLSRFRILFKLV